MMKMMVSVKAAVGKHNKQFEFMYLCFLNVQAAEVSYEDLLGAKQLGFSDKQIAKCIHK